MITDVYNYWNLWTNVNKMLINTYKYKQILAVKCRILSSQAEHLDSRLVCIKVEFDTEDQSLVSKSSP